VCKAGEYQKMITTILIHFLFHGEIGSLLIGPIPIRKLDWHIVGPYPAVVLL